MQAFIKQPERIPFFLKLGILISEKSWQNHAPCADFSLVSQSRHRLRCDGSIVAHADEQMTRGCSN
jgi:hypothetical protein